MFGMGTGVALSTQPPENLLARAWCLVRLHDEALKSRLSAKNLFGSGVSASQRANFFARAKSALSPRYGNCEISDCKSEISKNRIATKASLCRVLKASR